MNKLSKINFNLLKSLDSLLRQCSVKKAAEEQCITQSAMSQNLKRLRILLNDALLVRGQASNMHLTDKASQLIPAIQQAIDSLSNVFRKEIPFDLKTVNATVRIGIPPYLSSIIVPPLLDVVRKSAPGLRLVITNLFKVKTSMVFTNRDVDIAISYLGGDIKNVYSKPLFTDTGVVIAHPKHRMWQEFNGHIDSIKQCDIVYFTNKEKLFHQPELIYSGKSLSKTCRILAVLSDPLVAIQAASLNNAVTFSSAHFASEFLEKYHLISKKIQSSHLVNVSIYWHEIINNNPLHQWLISEIERLFAT